MPYISFHISFEDLKVHQDNNIPLLLIFFIPVACPFYSVVILYRVRLTDPSWTFTDYAYTFRFFQSEEAFPHSNEMNIYPQCT